jgi:hypothetical protein
MDNISFDIGWYFPEYDFSNELLFMWGNGHSIIKVHDLKFLQLTIHIPHYTYPNNTYINGIRYDLLIGDNILNINTSNLSRIEIIVKKTFTGNEVHNNGDTRPLGIMLKKIMIMPINALIYSEINIAEIKVNQTCDKIHGYIDTSPEISKEMVICHYNQNLEWTNLLPIKYKIYSKTLDTDGTKNIIRHTNLNKGHEALGYLDYILDNYNSLPDKVLFFHDDKFPWHMSKCIFCTLDFIDWSVKYKNINNPFFIFYTSKTETVDNKTHLPYQMIVDNITGLFRDYLPIPNQLKTITSAQFVVDKSLILQYPPEFYKSIKHWILSTDIQYIPAFYNKHILRNSTQYITHTHILEVLWHYIFTHNEIEPVD